MLFITGCNEYFSCYNILTNHKEILKIKRYANPFKEKHAEWLWSLWFLQASMWHHREFHTAVLLQDIPQCRHWVFPPKTWLPADISQTESDSKILSQQDQFGPGCPLLEMQTAPGHVLEQTASSCQYWAGIITPGALQLSFYIVIFFHHIS